MKNIAFKSNFKKLILYINEVENTLEMVVIFINFI